jgi:DNA-binding MarR family transcriptional regulator
MRTAATARVDADALAELALPTLRACAAIATASLEQVAPSVTHQQFRALTVLHEQGPLNAATLASALGIARSTLTRLADRLVRDGLVDRIPDPSDRRAVVLTASRRGRRIAAAVKARRLQELSRRLEASSPEDLDRLTDALVRVGALLTAGPPSP